MQILAALTILSALGSLFTEDNLSLKGIDLHKIDGILLPRTKITENLFVWHTITYKNYQKYYVGCAWISTGNWNLLHRILLCLWFW